VASIPHILHPNSAFNCVKDTLALRWTTCCLRCSTRGDSIVLTAQMLPCNTLCLRRSFSTSCSMKAGGSGGGGAAAEARAAEAAFAAKASARSYLLHGSRVAVDPCPKGGHPVAGLH
jgi:hypothetical protein